MDGHVTQCETHLVRVDGSLKQAQNEAERTPHEDNAVYSPGRVIFSTSSASSSCCSVRSPFST